MFNWKKNNEKPTIRLEGCLNPSTVEMCTTPGHGGYPKATCWHCYKESLGNQTSSTNSFDSSVVNRTTVNLDDQ